MARKQPDESFEVQEAKGRGPSCPGPLVSRAASDPPGFRCAASDSPGVLPSGRFECNTCMSSAFMKIMHVTSSSNKKGTLEMGWILGQ